MKISIVWDTGLVGRNIIELCEEYFDNSVEYHLYASKESEGKTLQVNGKEVPIRELSSKNIESCDIALFSAGGERSREFANQFVDKGAFVIDNSSSFRMEKTVPLVVYGINEDIIKNDSKIIANPNCTTMALVMALKPLHDIFNLLSIVPVSYQAVSGSGKSAIESLENELANLSTPGSAPDEKYYQSQIAKNVIPIAGNITENGYSDEEMKFSNESKKILDIPDLNVEPSNARVGVETGHGIFCTATFEKDVDVDVKDEIDIDDESEESDIEVKSELPGEDAKTSAVLGLLTKAQEDAEKIGDPKLTDQIGNTITFFTRKHVVKSTD